MKRIILILLVLISFNLTNATDVSGPVSGVWTSSGNPYHAIGDIWIPSSDTLVMNSGVHLCFLDVYNFDIYGSIIVNGVLGDSVYIASHANIEKWGSMNFYDEGVSDVQYSVIGYFGERINIYRNGIIFANSKIKAADHDDMSGSYCYGIYVDNNVYECIFRDCYLETYTTAYGYSPGQDVSALAICIDGGQYLTLEGNYIVSKSYAFHNYGFYYAHSYCYGLKNSEGYFKDNYFELWSTTLGGNSSSDNQAYAVFQCSGILESNHFNIESQNYHACPHAIYNFNGDIVNNVVEGIEEAGWGSFDSFIHYDGLFMNNTVVLWGNPTDGVVITGSGIATNNIVYSLSSLGCSCFQNYNINVSYNNIFNLEPGVTGIGNIQVYPEFVDLGAGDFHLQSIVGSYHGGLWLPDPDHSPCIDAGDPVSQYGNEPEPNGGRVNMGAYGNTAEASLSNIVVVNQNDPGIPISFKLYPPHPNPFNPSTTISYALPEACEVELIVYDIRGREVRTLVNQQQSPGVHEVTFDGSDLASGIYVYHIEAGEYERVNKMVLLK